MKDYKNIVIANWKMKLDLNASADLAEQMEEQFREFEGREVVLCPDFVSLVPVKEKLSEFGLKLGAQDMSWEEKGSYTGEVSPLNLKNAGCEYVILGHSERRKYLLEDYQVINRKVKAALAQELTPIMCIGEKAEEKQGGNRKEVLEEQLRQGLAGVELKKEEKLIVAYEPVWAIGSGDTITDEDIRQVYSFLDSVLKELFPKKNQDILTIYGGSVNSDNVSEFADSDFIDGLLVGGASLQAEEFFKISEIIINNNS